MLNQPKNLFSDLTEVMVLYILSKLDPGSLGQIMLVSKRMLELAQHQDVWIDQLKKKFAINYNHIQRPFSQILQDLETRLHDQFDLEVTIEELINYRSIISPRNLYKLLEHLERGSTLPIVESIAKHFYGFNLASEVVDFCVKMAREMFTQRKNSVDLNPQNSSTFNQLIATPESGCPIRFTPDKTQYEFVNVAFKHMFTALMLVYAVDDFKFCQTYKPNEARLDPSVYSFLCYGIRNTPIAQKFIDLIELSKIRHDVAPRAAWAISLLNIAGQSFAQQNLSGIHIPNADLSGAVLFDADLRNADLTNVILKNPYLRNANLENSCLEGINFLSGTMWTKPPRFNNYFGGPQALVDDFVNATITPSPCGRFLALSHSINNAIQIWDMGSGCLLRTIQGHQEHNISIFTIRKYHEQGILQIEFSPNGKFLAYRYPKAIIILDTMSWQEIGNLILHNNDEVYEHITFDSNNRLLAIFEKSDKNVPPPFNFLRFIVRDVILHRNYISIYTQVFDPSSRQTSLNTKHLSFHPDEYRKCCSNTQNIVAIGEKAVRIFDIHSFELVGNFKIPDLMETDVIRCCSLSSDNKLVVSTLSAVFLWDTARFKQLPISVLDAKSYSAVNPCSITFNPAGNLLAFVNICGTTIYDVSTLGTQHTKAQVIHLPVYQSDKNCQIASFDSKDRWIVVNSDGLYVFTSQKTTSPYPLFLLSWFQPHYADTHNRTWKVRDIEVSGARWYQGDVPGFWGTRGTPHIVERPSVFTPTSSALAVNSSDITVSSTIVSVGLSFFRPPISPAAETDHETIRRAWVSRWDRINSDNSDLPCNAPH